MSSRVQETNSTASPPPSPSTTSFTSALSQRTIVEDIQTTITELELCLMEQHHTELGLRSSLQAQTEQLHDLQTSLEVERNRNQRLAKLIRRVDSSTSSSGSESTDSTRPSRWRNSRTSMDAFESISPLLMQHRFHELSMSYQQCQRQLSKKDNKLRETQCELEMLQAKYDNLLNEYKGAQKRVEELCCKYLRLHANKNRELFKMKEALGYATRCIMTEPNYDENEKEVFRRNLQLFIRALKTSVHEENRHFLKDM